MAEVHQGSVALRNDFSTIHHWLQMNGQIDLITRRGIRFCASGTETVRGLRKGEKVIRFYSGTRELGRAYECCWGHRRNCSGKTIGTFCQPLDNVAI